MFCVLFVFACLDVLRCSAYVRFRSSSPLVRIKSDRLSTWTSTCLSCALDRSSYWRYSTTSEHALDIETQLLPLVATVCMNLLEYVIYYRNLHCLPCLTQLITQANNLKCACGCKDGINVIRRSI